MIVIQADVTNTSFAKPADRGVIENFIEHFNKSSHDER